MRCLTALCAMLLSAGCAARQLHVSVVPPLVLAPRASLLWAESFDALRPARWREVEVRRRTAYRAARVDGRPCLQADSKNGASILMTAVRFDPRAYPWLSWQWRVDQPVDGEALDTKRGSDAAARVYVYFETPGLPWQKRNLDYVWSASLPPGTLTQSAFSAQSKIFVLAGGREALGTWRTEERNLAEDYRNAFGEEPPEVIALGLMTDTDNTGTTALAYFDELRISRRSLAAPGTGHAPRRGRVSP